MSEDVLVHGGSIALLVVVTGAALSIIVRTLRNGVPPMPTSRRVRARMMEVMRQLDLSAHAAVVELGSGWGTLSLTLCRELPSALVTAYENSPVPLGFSFAAGRLVRAVNLRFVRADFYGVSLREADLVVCYLSPAAMARLQPKFEAELKPSAVVVSSTFALPVWKATRTVVADDMYRTRIYVYLVGGCRSGAVGRHIDIVESPSDGSSDSAELN